METVIVKFGGTSLGSVERIKAAAAQALDAQRAGKKIVVVVSAMAGETDRLLSLAKLLTPNPSPEELDVVASTGEQVSAGLFALAIQSLGGKGLSLNASQLGIFTDDNFGEARILNIDTAAIEQALEKGAIPVITGFQGITSEGRISTLGRGGSDTTALALAAALEASECVICTDVEGVFSSDPRSNSASRKLDTIAPDEMLLLAQAGSKVLHTRSVAIARDYHVPLNVRSSFTHTPGTRVAMPSIENVGPSAMSVDEKVALVRIEPNGTSAQDYVEFLVSRGVRFEFFQAAENGTVSLLLSAADLAKVRENLNPFQIDESVSKITIVGRGMQSSATTFQKVFEIFRRNAVPLRASSVTELSMSLLISKKDSETMTRTIHQELFA